jgi:hypothetical protein
VKTRASKNEDRLVDGIRIISESYNSAPRPRAALGTC